MIGFFISLVGGLEITAGLLFSGRRFMNGLYQALGYLTIWISALYYLGFLLWPSLG